VVQPLGGGDYELHEEDLLRARFYGLLANLLSGPPGPEILDGLTRLEGDETDMGQALGALADVAATATPEQVEREFTDLFIGLTEGELTPYASYYLTGFLYEKPLADLRADMEALGLRSAEDVAEPEDHIASLFEMMHWLITGSLDTPADLKTQQQSFNTHLNGWASRFFEDLEAADPAVFYRPIGTIGRTFMAIEREAFSMVE
jgi:TorA maturation chaperone TorD